MKEGKIMKRQIRAFITVILICMMMSGSALAQPIHFTRVIPAISATAEDGQKKLVESSVIQLLGWDEAGNGIIFVNGEYLTVEASVLKSVLRGVDLDSLPNVTAYWPIDGNGFGENVYAVQDCLIKLGYLEGTADGDLGPRTKNALRKFRADVGLEQADVVDVRMQMLMNSMAQNQITITGTTPLTVLEGRTAIDLQPLYDSGLVFEYDDLAGTGLISGGEAIICDVSGSRDIDQHLYSVRFGLSVTEEEDGKATLEPVMLVDCLCVRSPIMESVILKSGSSRSTADVSTFSSTLDGIKILEQAVIRLDNSCVSLLSHAEENGELKIRVNGKNMAHDLIIPKEELGVIETIAKTAIDISK